MLASDLLLQRRRIAAMLLKAARIEPPPDLLQVGPPSDEWVNGIAQKPELRICTPQELEAAHRQFCDHLRPGSVNAQLLTSSDALEHRFLEQVE
jgi:hypothetical protein